MQHTAPLPRLEDKPTGLSVPGEGQRLDCPKHRRREVLYALGAQGQHYVWPHFTLMVTWGGLWVAQDDYFPPEGEPDPIPAEWREVLELCRQFGYWNLGEPLLEPTADVFVWTVLRLSRKG